MQSNEVTIDVRNMVPRERHPTIFNTWNSLPAGAAILIVNDHDPLPLYYQFAVEHRGGFRWDYLEQGPDTWRVRIDKGPHADPGFTPGARRLPTLQPAPAPAPAPSPLVLDVRPIFAQGGSPCSAIDAAVDSLQPGQSLVLLVPFEPVPLYGKLGARGLDHAAEQLADGTWQIVFSCRGTPRPAAPGSSCGCSGH